MKDTTMTAVLIKFDYTKEDTPTKTWVIRVEAEGPATIAGMPCYNVTDGAFYGGGTFETKYVTSRTDVVSIPNVN